ncbi:MAG: Fur family transcriptional regulator [Oscillospiraceae bacterium]
MVITKKKDFSNDLARNGLKTTKHRTEILAILAASDQPLAAEQVFLELKKREISVNLSTVYRVLEVLSDKNLVLKITIPGETRTLFEYNRMVHKHYLICLGCNKILAINSCPLGDYEKSLAKETHYFIAGHKLDIYGYCPECREKYSHEE